MEFKITYEEWKNNREEAIKLIEKNPRYLKSRTTKGNFTGDYFNWLVVWRWLKSKYEDFVFETTKIELGSEVSGYIKGKLTINNKVLGELSLNLESFKKSDGTYYQETAEQLQMRVFVKLVANITGFGIHLWEKGI